MMRCCNVGWLAAIGFGCGGPASPSLPVDDRLADIAEIQLYETAACARNTSGAVFCWGDQHGNDGEPRSDLERSGRTNRPRLIEGATEVVRLGTKHNVFGYTTAVRADGEILAWPGVDLRPTIEIYGRGDEKRDPDSYVRVVPRRRHGQRPRDPEPWRAIPSGLTVGDPDIFADTGCFYDGALVSCPGITDPANIASYDGLVWGYEPGIESIAVIEIITGPRDPTEEGVCRLFVDGGIECRVGGVAHSLNLPARPKKIFGGAYLTALLEDGRVVISKDGSTVGLRHEISDVVDLDVDTRGFACGLLRGGQAECWTGVGAAPDIIELEGVGDAISIHVAEGLTWCVIDSSRHVKCGGVNRGGQRGTADDSDFIEQAKYVIAPG